jgi:hypothetical protein
MAGLGNGPQEPFFRGICETMWRARPKGNQNRRYRRCHSKSACGGWPRTGRDHDGCRFGVTHDGSTDFAHHSCGVVAGSTHRRNRIATNGYVAGCGTFPKYLCPDGDGSHHERSRDNHPPSTIHHPLRRRALIALMFTGHLSAVSLVVKCRKRKLEQVRPRSGKSRIANLGHWRSESPV